MMKIAPTASLMLHSVGTPAAGWNWSFLTVPWPIFDGMLRWLRRMGYSGVTLAEYIEVCRKNRLRQERVVSLTFDDGYLDNWVCASVLLEKYNFRGTVFVSGDFIDPSAEPRPRWNGESGSPLPEAKGFLNAGELKRLDASGVLDVQAHAMTHTWYPCGPAIVDFRHPGDRYHWMDWNNAPEDKWRALQPPENPSVWGEPVYEHRKALQGPRFFPNPTVAAALREYVGGKGESFFSRPGWRETLFRMAGKLQADLSAGEHEEWAAYMARAEWEMTASAGKLASLLGKDVPYLCWPGGGYSPEVFALAARHFAGTTIGSADRGRQQGEDASGCYRFTRLGPLHTGGNADIRYMGALTNALYIEERRTGGKPCRLVRGTLTRLAQWRII